MVKLIDAARASQAEYIYNAWGQIIYATGTLASVNPILYRGYYCDLETGFYYLKSRYYDPVICRFINADDLVSTGQGFLGCNMFAYCGNNPVNRVDEGGNFSITVASAIVGFVVGGISQIVTNVMQGNEWSDGVFGAAVGGAVYGIFAVHGPVLAGYVAAAAEAFTNEALSYLGGKKELSAENIASSALTVAGRTLVNGSLYAVSGMAANTIVPFDPKTVTYGVGSLVHGRIIHKVWAQSTVQATMIIGEKIVLDSLLSPSVSKPLIA